MLIDWLVFGAILGLPALMTVRVWMLRKGNRPWQRHWYDPPPKRRRQLGHDIAPGEYQKNP